MSDFNVAIVCNAPEATCAVVATFAPPPISGDIACVAPAAQCQVAVELPHEGIIGHYGTQGGDLAGGGTASTSTQDSGAAFSLWGFGFDLGDAAVVTGIEVSLAFSTGGVGGRDFEVQLIDDHGVIGAPKGPVHVDAATPEYHTLGASDDKWGASINGALVRSDEFGVVITAAYVNGFALVAVYDVVVTVYYSVGAFRAAVVCVAPVANCQVAGIVWRMAAVTCVASVATCSIVGSVSATSDVGRLVDGGRTRSPLFSNVLLG